MTDRKKPPKALDLPFGEALARFLKTKPDELAESIAEEVLRETDDEKAHKKRVREALEDGARPKRGRFRL